MCMRRNSPRAVARFMYSNMARQVLCDFEGRRSPLLRVRQHKKALISAVKTVFADVISWKVEDSYCLEVDTKEHSKIDVLGCSEPVQTVFLRYWKSPEDDVSIYSNMSAFTPDTYCMLFSKHLLVSKQHEG